MRPKVSVLMPCHNAARWVGEAIESCLRQADVDLEVIAIDDGSTDGTLNVLKDYGDKIVVESQAQRGGNAARNRAFEMSSGDFIQYLDADDFILPGKLRRQVDVLEETGTDVVYGDWRYLHHSPQAVEFGPVVIARSHDDIVEALLSPWWVANSSPLYRRSSVSAVGRWDEAVRANQDGDFILSVAVSGARFIYQPGLCAVYRRLGGGTVSTSNLKLWVSSTRSMLEKYEQQLQEAGQLTPARRSALARTYFYLARKCYKFDRAGYHEMLRRCRDLGTNFTVDQPTGYRVAQRVLGFRGAEVLAQLKRSVIGETNRDRSPR